MFYNLHRDAIIGYKKLSDADLGINPNGHQTHIGLFENTLNFINSHNQFSTSQLIYNDLTIETETFLGYIENQDGSYRSPKIRSSNIGTQSTVRIIREIASKVQGKTLYLMWFELSNEDLVFILIEENSPDYMYFSDLLGNLTRGTIHQKNPLFTFVMKFLNTKVNDLNINYFEELEVFAETKELNIIKKKNPKPYDIIKAQQLFQKIGRKGEELVNIHLEKSQTNGDIKSFNWVNKNTESGFPFDFEIINNSNQLIYSDAKSTSYRFEQKIFFSSQELKFIQKNNNYLIHRIYNLYENPKLRVCNNISDISHNFIDNLNNFTYKVLQDELKVNSVKISLKPTHASLVFDEVII